jgi:hypothetical protein
MVLNQKFVNYKVVGHIVEHNFNTHHVKAWGSLKILNSIKSDNLKQTLEKLNDFR